MKMCPLHWERLKELIRSKGLWDFVSSSGEEACQRMRDELDGKSVTKKTFDPLIGAHNMIVNAALEMGGIYVIGVDEEGNDYCPICEAEKHDAMDWPEKAVDAVVEMMRGLPDG
jgi:hypothetical protein